MTPKLLFTLAALGACSDLSSKETEPVTESSPLCEETTDFREACLLQTDPEIFQPTHGVRTSGYGDITIGNGTRKHPHAGVDIAPHPPATDSNPDVYAVMDGTVTRAVTGEVRGSGSGNVVEIMHPGTPYGNCVSTYKHNSEVFVEMGDPITAGTLIAEQGNTGYTVGRTGTHLHFEWACDEEARNPEWFFQVEAPNQ